MAEVVALKVADMAAAATVTDAGTVRVALLLVRTTEAPPVGAAWDRVTVQVLVELGPRLVGLQASEVVDAAPLNARTAADQMSATFRVDVALVVMAVTATRSPDSAQLEFPHPELPLTDISRFV